MTAPNISSTREIGLIGREVRRQARTCEDYVRAWCIHPFARDEIANFPGLVDCLPVWELSLSTVK